MTRMRFPCPCRLSLSRPNLASLLVLLLVSAGAVADPPEWQELGPAPVIDGPYAGRVSAIVCSPTNANRWFAGAADGGVWRTTDGGTTWVPLTDHLPNSAVGALAMDPTDENVLYCGTGEANFANHSRYGLGIYRTADGGDTWDLLGESTFAGRCISRILIDPAAASVLYAAATKAGGFPEAAAARNHPQAAGPLGVFKSLDSGQTWTQLAGGLPALTATDLAMDPVDSQVLYAAIGHIFGSASNGIYKTVNGGTSWTKLAGGLPAANVGRISLAAAPSAAGTVYALYTAVATASGGNASTLNVYKTLNGGTTWTATNPGNFQSTYGWYLSTVSVQPSNANTVIVGGVTQLRSTNGGTNWTDITPPHVDMHALAWDAAGRLLSGNDGGVHRSTDLGNTWTAHNNGLGCIQFYAGLSLSPAGPNYIYGGTQDNGSNYRNTASLNWTGYLGGDGGWTGVRPSLPQYVFGEWQGTGNLYRFTNYGAGGSTYVGTGISASDRNCFLPPYVINPLNDAQMLYGTQRIYYSANAGASWTARSGDLTTGTGAIRCLVLAPSNPQVVYAVTNDGNVQVTTNFGSNWTLVRSGVPGWPRTTRQVAVDPGNDSRALLAVSSFGIDQVLLTENRGTSWTPIDGDLPDIPVNSAAIAARPGPDVFYAGTDAGVYASADGGAHWQKLANGLPNAAVIDLLYDAPRQRLVAATQGRGAWLLPILAHGDFDGDNDVDVEDCATFAECLFGPGSSPAPVPPHSAADCLGIFDFDSDGDVDLDDFAAFQVAFTG